ncbi:alpha/beta-hydrolase [Dentipellis sp. KUC8613]|nr:alpha/beta-hydrolase [Dentipellis sp. KUC8613]
MSHRAYMAMVDPEFAQAAAAMPARAAVEDVTVQRQQFQGFVDLMNAKTKSSLPPVMEYRLENHKVPVDGGDINVRCFIPTSQVENNHPLLVWYHGGGWCVGTSDIDDHFLRHVCVTKQVSIVSVDYRLAPEHPYPTPNNDCYYALKWAAENAEILNVSLTTGFIVAGISSGGNAAVIVARRAASDPYFSTRPLTGQILQVPVIFHSSGISEQWKSEILSRTEFTNDPFLSQRSIQRVERLYQADTHDPDAWPLLQPSHGQLPPTVIQICGRDPLRDENFLFERELRQAGVQTRLYKYPGVPHGFHVFFPGLKLAKRFHEEFHESIRWLSDGARDQS